MTRSRTQGVPLSPADRARVLALVQRDGERATRERLGVARATLARCAAGLPVQRAVTAPPPAAPDMSHAEALEELAMAAEVLAHMMATATPAETPEDALH